LSACIFIVYFAFDKVLLKNSTTTITTSIIYVEFGMTSGDSGVWICAQSTAETATEAFQPADTSSSNSHPGYHLHCRRLLSKSKQIW